jgi:hypothetical protein
MRRYRLTDATDLTVNRWEPIERLVADADLVRRDSAELDQDARDDWAKSLVQSSAFLHVTAEPACAGYTLASSGRASCGLCGWRMSARLGDVGTVESALFAGAVLARVGAAVELAIGEVLTALFEVVGFECRCDRFGRAA